MNKEVVSYEQAIVLKELGFDEPCIGAFTSEMVFERCSSDYWNYRLLDIINRETTSDLQVLAPLKQQVLRWFRDNGYRYTIYFDITEPGRYMFDVFKRDEEKKWWQFNYESRLEYETYEDAENACIDKLIELTKKK